MKKIFYFILLIVISFNLCGCGNNYNIDKMNNVIISLFNSELDVRGLNKKESNLINNFVDKEKEENKSIKLDDFFEYSVKSSETNSNGVYENNNSYFVKYDSLIWSSENTYDSDCSSYTYVIANGYKVYLCKTDFPILYDDTKNSEIYDYNYLGKKETDDKIDIYYSSSYNENGLIIEYIKDNNDIIDINLIYEPYTSYIEEETTNQSSNIGTIVEMLILSIGCIALAYVVIKKVRTRNTF